MTIFRQCYELNYKDIVTLYVELMNAQDLAPVSRTSRKVFGPEKPFQKPRRFLCTELFMSTGFAFKQSLHLCSIANLKSFWF